MDWKKWSTRGAIVLPFALPFYLIRFRIGPFPTTLLECLVILFCILFTIGFGWSGWKKAWSALGVWRLPMLAWFFTGLVAVFVSPNLIAGFGLWRAYILEPLLMFCLLFIVLSDSLSRQKARQALFLSVIPIAVWALAQFLTGYGIPHPWDVSILAGRRATGPYPFPNALALFCTPIGAWAFVVWVRERRDWISCLGWIAAFIAIACAKSQGGIAAFVIVSWLALVSYKPWRSRILIGSALMLAIVGLVPAIRNPLWREMSFQGWSGQVRLFQWRETRQMLHDHWFFGAGMSGYPMVFKPYHKATAIEIFQYPHNIILNFWTEMGLLGLGVFLWIVIIWFRLARRSPKMFLLSAAPLLAMLIHGMVDVPYFKNDLALLFWLMVFLATKSASQAPVQVKGVDD